MLWSNLRSLDEADWDCIGIGIEMGIALGLGLQPQTKQIGIALGLQRELQSQPDLFSDLLIVAQLVTNRPEMRKIMMVLAELSNAGKLSLPGTYLLSTGQTLTGSNTQQFVQ